jgi:hypothetical protein
MTRDDVIRMAREAGWGPFTAELYAKPLTIFFERAYKAGAAAEADRIANESKHIIKRAEERGAAAERERCAKLCAEDGLLWGQRYAAAIRARGDK